MPNIIVSESSGVTDSFFGKWNAPLCSFMTERSLAFEEQSIGSKLFRTVKSNHAMEGYSGSTGVESWDAVGENGAHPTGGFEEAYKKIIPNFIWKGSVSVSYEMIRHNTVDINKPANKFMQDFYNRREHFLAKIIGEALQGHTSFAQGVYTVDTTSADGVCLFSTSHAPKVKGGNQTNLYADAFSYDALVAACTAMQNLKDDDGRILAMHPDTIIIPNIAALKQAVWSAVGSYSNPDNANGQFNFVQGTMNVWVWPELNDHIGNGTTPWLIADSSFLANDDCLVLQEETDVELTPIVERNNARTWDGYASFGAGAVDFRGIMACGISGGSNL